MKRIRLACLSAAVLVMAIAGPTAAQPTFEAYQEKGRNAFAYGDDCAGGAEQPCIWWSVWIFDGSIRANGERFRGPQVCVSLGASVYDSAEERFEDEYRDGCTPDADQAIAKDLLSARAAGAIPTESQSCWYDPQTDEGDCSERVPADDIAVDVEWTGEPPVRRGSWRDRSQFGDCLSTTSSKGTSVFATASGSIGGEATEFVDAAIGNGSYRYSSICHG